MVCIYKERVISMSWILKKVQQGEITIEEALALERIK